MKKKPPALFQDFVMSFPMLDLPVILSEEAHHIFSSENEPLQAHMIQRYILPVEGEVDEMTEFIPCFRIPETHGFHALVYWKASLLTYEYVLVTFGPQGELIDRKVIAGTHATDEVIAKTVATIDRDWSIYIVGGVSNRDEELYNPKSSQSVNMELLASGEIINLN